MDLRFSLEVLEDEYDRLEMLNQMDEGVREANHHFFDTVRSQCTNSNQWQLHEIRLKTEGNESLMILNLLDIVHESCTSLMTSRPHRGMAVHFCVYSLRSWQTTQHNRSASPL